MMKTAKGMKKNTVPYGKGEAYQSGPSGRNKPAALNDAGIKAGAPVKKGMVKNDGHSSPIGKQRPTQDGGPRSGQTSGVDFKIGTDKLNKADWAWKC